jgi:hypothetical protein
MIAAETVLMFVDKIVVVQMIIALPVCNFFKYLTWS